MPHSQQKHAYKSNIHKIRRNLKTKYNDNIKKKQKNNAGEGKVWKAKIFGMYTEADITQLTMLGGKLLKRLKRTKEPNQTDNESRCKRDEKCFPQIWDCVYAVGFH